MESQQTGCSDGVGTVTCVVHLYVEGSIDMNNFLKIGNTRVWCITAMEQIPVAMWKDLFRYFKANYFCFCIYLMSSL